MPARVEEVHHAKDEGIHFEMLAKAWTMRTIRFVERIVAGGEKAGFHGTRRGMTQQDQFALHRQVLLSFRFTCVDTCLGESRN